MRKRFILCIITLLIGMVSNAQPFELGFSTGTAVNGTCKIDAGCDIAYMFDALDDLKLGFGAGLHYARPIYEIMNLTRDDVKTKEKTFANELAVPFFGRVRYSVPNNIFFQVDAGYRIALIDMVWWFPGNNLSGGYFEPQVGYKFDQRRSLSIGVSHQQCQIDDRIDITSTAGDFTVGITEKVKIWRSVAFIRYCKTL